MFKIGDIVRPKIGFIGHDFCFKVIEIKLNPFGFNLYKLQRITQILDPTNDPLNLQLKIIRNVETTSWKEKELELTSNVTLRYNVADLDDMIDANRVDLKTCKIKIDRINKEENKMQILDIYEERKRKVLDRVLLEDKEKVKGEDEIQSIILEMTNQVNTILENQGKKIKYEFEPNLITAKTEVKLDELNDNYYKEVESLHSTVKEIKAMFELTDDYNERMKILRRYGIINKDGKLSV